MDTPSWVLNSQHYLTHTAQPAAARAELPWFIPCTRVSIQSWASPAYTLSSLYIQPRLSPHQL